MKQWKFFGIIIGVLIFGFSINAQEVGDVGIGFGVVLKPNRLEITPALITLNEGSADVQLTAMAFYDYPGLVPPIAPINVTADVGGGVVWSSSNSLSAMINTIGVVTPVSALGTGSLGNSVLITVQYQDLSATSVVKVVGVDSTSFPSTNSGGGSQDVGVGGGFGQSSSQGRSPIVDIDRETGGESIDQGGQSESDNSGNFQANQQGNIDGDQLPTNLLRDFPILNPDVVIDQVIDLKKYFVDLYKDFEVNDLVKEIVENLIESTEKVPEKIGVARGEFIYYLLGEKGLRIFEFKKELLEKGVKDMKSLVGIFMLFTLNDEIKAKFESEELLSGKLWLYPDVAISDFSKGVKLANVADAINLATLLGIVNGYYNSIVEGEITLVSPFLSEKKVSRVELLKVVLTALAIFDNEIIDHSLFYKSVYETYLEILNSSKRFNLGRFSWFKDLIVQAKAQEISGKELIKNQKSLFVDVRPDLYEHHWYYPMVLDKACELGIYENCKNGVKADPDGVPNEEEVLKYIDNARKYADKKNLFVNYLKDSDNDLVRDLDEKGKFFTNMRVKDTDEDGLEDGNEVYRFRTDPNVSDTDGDKLVDGDEILIYKTNPLNRDTDGDRFDDKIEIDAGSDPLNSSSTPLDKNKNGVSDEWETLYNIIVESGHQDTDKDGVSDYLEFQYGTNPRVIDTDGDGFTDAEEILDYLSNPLDASDPGDRRNFDVKIVNFINGQVVADKFPMIKGVAPASLGGEEVSVQVLLRNEYGMEKVLGVTKTDQKGIFVMIPEVEFRDGRYYLLARSLQFSQIKMSKPILIEVNTKLQVPGVKPEKLEDKKITDEVLIKNLRLEINKENGKPILYGVLNDYGARVNLVWKSLAVSNALVVDAASGDFSMEAPVLEEGDHQVFIQVVSRKTNVVGKTIVVYFTLSKKPLLGLDRVKEDFLEGKIDINTFAAYLKGYGLEWWMIVIGIIVIIGVRIAFKFVKKK